MYSQTPDRPIFSCEGQVRLSRLEGVKGLTRITKLDQEAVSLAQQSNLNLGLLRKMSAPIANNIAKKLIKNDLQLAKRGTANMMIGRKRLYLLLHQRQAFKRVVYKEV